ncbi:MAG: HD domain-containing protein [Sphingobacteriia bacterium]|nr:HD domain-containing protein [Sphingobacteriia bacterium]
MSILNDALKDPIFARIGKTADRLQQPTWVVGGFVRDYLLGHPGKDLDIVTVGSGTELATAIAEELNAPEIVIFENFGTALVKSGDYQIEFIGARKESYRKNSRKPIVEDGSLIDDQNRRDFTINSFYISLNQENYGEFLDPFNGLEDLKQGIIRTPLNPDLTFSDDPLRMMRAARFAARLDYQIDPLTFEAISRNKQRIEIVSMERVSEELNKLILSPWPSKGFMVLFKTGLLEIIFPEFCKLHGVKYINGKGHKDNFYHTLQVLENLCTTSDDLWLRWSALLHDIAKPQTAAFDPIAGWSFHGHEDKGARMVPKIFARLKLPMNEKMKFVQKMVKLHLRPISLVDEIVTDSAVRRLIMEAGEDLDDLIKLCRADITTRDTGKQKRYQNNFTEVEKKIKEVEERDQLRNWQPPVSGEMIMEYFKLAPGPQVGEIKNMIREAILEGHIPNDKAAAWDLMIQIGTQLFPSNPPE